LTFRRRRHSRSLPRASTGGGHAPTRSARKRSRRLCSKGREGGRWYERDTDGSECEWGKVLVWEPPSQLVLAWQITGEWAYDADFRTEVEVTFVPDGPNRTLVEVEHRGLEAYGDQASDMRDQFNSPGGWPSLLEAFAATASS
jgi:uncharacterized protein YndB with AHSA1/START domain